jgi:hypothetical protein
MTRSRARRRVLAMSLRALRLARQHYFSMLSAGVLGAALVVALTSSSLEVSGGATARPAVAPFTPWPTATPGVMPAKVPAAPELHLLVYYLVDSQAARDQLLMAHQSDVTYWGQREMLSTAGEMHEVLVVKNPEEEAAAMVFMDDLWKLAQVEDFALHFVDLR